MPGLCHSRQLYEFICLSLPQSNVQIEYTHYIKSSQLPHISLCLENALILKMK